jgi:hypothetical protein
MTLTVTLSDLQTAVRSRADMIGSKFVTDPELVVFINSSMQTFYDMLIDAIEDYNVSTSNFTLTSSDNGVKALPTDFYKLRGLDDITDTDNPRTVRKFNWNERNEFSLRQIALVYDTHSDVMYRINGSNLIFEPPANAAKPYKLWYYPLPTLLVNPGDTFDSINGWHEFVVLDAAIKCLDKEESDSSSLKQERQMHIQRINNMKQSRDEGLPEKISRVRNRRRNRLAPFGGDFWP